MCDVINFLKKNKIYVQSEWEGFPAFLLCCVLALGPLHVYIGQRLHLLSGCDRCLMLTTIIAHLPHLLCRVHAPRVRFVILLVHTICDGFGIVCVSILFFI